MLLALNRIVDVSHFKAWYCAPRSAGRSVLRRAPVGASLLAAALFTSCGSVELPRATWVDADTQVTDEGGNEIPLRDAKRDFMLSSSAGDAQGGLPLKPGDVLYVRRWSAGFEANENRTSPLRVLDRIPLRMVREGGRLHEGEREFLLNLLVTNRQLAGSEDRPQLAKAIKESEVRLWNSVVETLRVRRIGEALAATVDLRRVLQPLTDKSYFGIVGPAPSEDSKWVDIAGIDNPPVDAEAAVFLLGERNKNTQYYATQDRSTEGKLFHFVSVLLGGVDVRNQEGEESLWSLRELQDSGVCFPTNQAPPRIAALRFSTSPRLFWIERGKPTYKVRRILTLDRRERSVEPIDKWEAWRKRAVLASTVLDDLTVRDVSEIFWRTDSGLTEGPARCSPRGGAR